MNLKRKFLLIEAVTGKPRKKRGPREERFLRRQRERYRGRLGAVTAKTPKALRRERERARRRRAGRLAVAPKKLQPKRARTIFRKKGQKPVRVKSRAASFRGGKVDKPLTIGQVRSLYM